MIRRFARLFIVALPLLLSLPVEAAPTSPPCAESAALVAEFLELSLEQRQNTERLLVERHQLAAPLQQQITILKRGLEALLEAGGSAEDVGRLMLEIHARH